jgi:hypothetical protein
VGYVGLRVIAHGVLIRNFVTTSESFALVDAQTQVQQRITVLLHLAILQIYHECAMRLGESLRGEECCKLSGEQRDRRPDFLILPLGNCTVNSRPMRLDVKYSGSLGSAVAIQITFRLLFFFLMYRRGELRVMSA